MDDFKKFDLGSFIKNTKLVQKRLEKIKASLNDLQAIGQAGVDAVKVTLNGTHKVLKVEISDATINSSKAILEGLIVAAFNDASNKIESSSKELMQAVVAEAEEDN